MIRRFPSAKWLLGFLCLAAPLDVHAQSHDPVMATVPFDQWMAQGEHANLPWQVTVSPAFLGPQQRLQININAKIDGKDLSKRPLTGELVFLLQVTDSANRIYQGHGIMKLDGMDKNVRKADIVYLHQALVTPGDYRVVLAMLHSNSREHSLAIRNIHVAPMAQEPLPQTWSGVPAVEILNAEEPPDAWYHPQVRGHLNLPLDTRRPVHIDLVMNLPSGPVTGQLYRAAMAELIASLRTLSQIAVHNGVLDITILDLTRGRIVFQQHVESELDWPRFKAALGAANPNTIDVGTLSNPGLGAEFFRAQISKRIERAASRSTEVPQPVLIVLGTPMGFPSGADLRPIERGGVDLPVYYILERLFVWRSGVPEFPFSSVGRRTRGMTPPPVQRGAAQEKPDSLEGTLKPLNPHLMEVSNPMQFRQALAALLADLSRF